jgi:hypothetical protein
VRRAEERRRWMAQLQADAVAGGDVMSFGHGCYGLRSAASAPWPHTDCPRILVVGFCCRVKMQLSADLRGLLFCGQSNDYPPESSPAASRKPPSSKSCTGQRCSCLVCVYTRRECKLLLMVMAGSPVYVRCMLLIFVLVTLA